MTPRDEEYTALPGKAAEPLGEKSTAELEAEINQIRSEMDTTLRAIEHRISPGEIVDRALHSIQVPPSEYFSSLGRSLRANPIPATLVGIGLGWLFLSESGVTRSAAAKTEEWESSGTAARAKGKLQQASHSVSDKLQHASHTVSERLHHTGERLHEAREKLTEKSHSWSERMHHTGEKASERMHRTGEKARMTRERLNERAELMRERAHAVRERAQQARGGFRQMREEKPLLLMAMGMAMGVVLGAVLPITRREEEKLGGTGAELLTRGKRLAEQSAEKAGYVASAAAEAAREEIERQRH